MLVRVLTLLALLGVSKASTNCVVVAPNVMRWNQNERVIVTLAGNTRTPVTLYFQDWPEKRNRFSRKTRSLQGNNNVLSFDDMMVRASDFPASDRLKLGERKYVYLVAEVGGQKQETVILMSSKIANVYVQPGKPVYTPGQPVRVTVYTTDLDNRPIHMPVRLDVVSPGGVVVQRKVLDTPFKTFINNEVKGMYRHDFTKLHRDIYEGKWTILASYGPRIGDSIEYVHNTSAYFEMKEYVLPTFGCKVKDVKNFIFKDSSRAFRGTVQSRYTHGSPVEGNVTVRFGIIDRDGNMDKKHVLYILTKYSLLIDGQYDFELDMERIYSKIPNFNFENHVEGKRLMIHAFCMESATGDRMEDVNSRAIFVTQPFTFDFSRTITHFKPGLPIVVQFQMLYRNGLEAKEQIIQVKAEGITGDGRRHSMSLAGYRDFERTLTDEHGRSMVIYAGRDDLKYVDVKFRVPVDDEGEELVPHDETLRLPAAASREKDVVIELNGRPPFTVGYSVDLALHFKGSVSEIIWLVLSRGRIVESGKVVGRFQGYQLLNVPVTQTMTPSARLVIFAVSGGDILGDSIWLDVEDECKTEMDVKIVSVDGERGPFQHSGWSPELKVKVEWEANSYVALQMVDHDRVHLTPRRMWEQMDSLDMGCGGGSGGNTSSMFARAGLAVSTLLKDATLNRQLNTGLRHYDNCDLPNDYSGRTKRQVRETEQSLEECCEEGTQDDKTGQQSRCEDVAMRFAFSRSPECLAMIKTCCRNTSQPEEEEESKRSKRSAFTEVERFDVELAIEDAEGVRENFEESKVHVAILDGIGRGSVRFTMPDSITTWSVEAVGMNDASGFCVAEPADFAVQKDRHMKVRLPFEAVRGEHLNARVTFYNFATIPTYVRLHMKGAEGICSGILPGRYTRPKELTVGPKRAHTVSWPIVPMKVGEITIRFIALTGSTRRPRVVDVVERVLKVKPEGTPTSTSVALSIDLNSGNIPRGEMYRCRRDSYNGANAMNCDINIKLPSGIVEDSAYGRIRVIGNTFGDTLDLIVNGVAGELRMGSGNGETIMIRVAPSVFAYEYLKQTGTATTSQETQIGEILSSGMQQLLRYRQSNGGFAVWSSPPAKTWLTSLIFKVYAKGKQIYNNAVDQHVLDGMASFLYSRQYTSGRDGGKFYEHSNGLLYYGSSRSLVGSIREDDLTLTAYIAIALAESRGHYQENPERLNLALGYLGRNVHHTRSPYEKAMVAYALSFSSDVGHKNRAYNTMKATAREETVQDSRVRYFGYGANKREQVEASSYAILTALRHGDVDYCYDIMIWLHRQRTNGGRIYTTTQDTIITLQALKEYSIATKDRETKLEVTLFDLKDPENPQKDFNITTTEKNMEIIEELDLSTVTSDKAARLRVRGNGVLQVSLEAMYNLQWKKRNGFDVRLDSSIATTNVQQPDGGQQEMTEMTIAVTTKYLEGDQTDMAMIEVGLLTGFKANKESLDKLVEDKKIDAFEISDAMVAMYLPYIRNDPPTSVQFKAVQMDRVENLSPAVVKVYDYYNKENEVIMFYPEDYEKLIPEVAKEDGKYVCLEGRCSQCYGLWATQYIGHREFADIVCTPRVNYAYHVQYIDYHEDDGWLITRVKVIRVFKGSLQIQPEMTLVVRQRLSCACPDIPAMADEIGDRAQFFIYGEDEAMVRDEDGNLIYQLTANSDMVVEEWSRRRLRPHIRLLANPC